MSNQQHTPEPFVREPRYLVFKIKDTEKYLTQGEKDSLMSIDDEISCARADEGKPPFNAVVVEQDWPEFDLVWEMIEARMTGKGNDASRIVAAVNACAGKPTELLELAAEFDAADEDAAWEPPHPIFRMASDMDRLAEQRDELLAAAIKAAEEIRKCDYTPARSTLLVAIHSMEGGAA